MDDELDPNIIKATQISLGKYVKRPPLSEKLLRKPPFRFLHDIVTSVLRNKGFFDGLFEENELISDNVKDRESKISFLNKFISVVSLTTGQSLSAKPSKIVAGQEPAKTNELLQCLAQALDQNLSSDEAVKQFKESIDVKTNSDKKIKESVKPAKKNIEPKKLTSKSSEKLISNNKNEKALAKSKHKEISAVKKESPTKKTFSKKPNKTSLDQFVTQQNDSNNENIKISSENFSTNDKQVQLKTLANKDHVALVINSSPNNKILESENVQDDLGKASDSIIDNGENESIDDDNILNPTATAKVLTIDAQPDDDTKKIQQEISKNDNVSKDLPKEEIRSNIEDHNKVILHDVISDSEVRKSGSNEARLHTENYHDIKDISNTITRPSSVRPSSSRPGAPRHRDKSDIINDTEIILVGKVNIISENSLEEEDEDTSIIIDNQIINEIQENQEENDLSSNKNSHLVQQILDSQKEYSQVSGKTEIEWRAGAQKTSDVFIQEMEQLRFSIQAMSRIANPLGKLLDHIQEDVEVMRQELQQWTKLYEETSKDLIKQKTATEESLLPLRTRLKQLSTNIKDKRDKITDVRVSIQKNGSKIERLLNNGNVQ